MRRRPALRELSREHHGALVLALRISKADDRGTQSLLTSVPELFARELEPHFQAEEKGLLPRLAEAGGQALVERTLEEHREMRELVSRIAAGDGASLKTFGLALRAHARFEERELFPAAEALLPAAYLDAEPPATPPTCVMVGE